MLYMATGKPAHCKLTIASVITICFENNNQLLHLVGLISLLSSMMLGTTNIKFAEHSGTNIFMPVYCKVC